VTSVKNVAYDVFECVSINLTLEANISIMSLVMRMNLMLKTRMVRLPATAAIEYVAACCRTRTRTRTKKKTGTKTKIGTTTKTVRGPYARSPQSQYVYAPSGLSVPSNVA